MAGFRVGSGVDVGAVRQEPAHEILMPEVHRAHHDSILSSDGWIPFDERGERGSIAEARVVLRRGFDAATNQMADERLPARSKAAQRVDRR